MKVNFWPLLGLLLLGLGGVVMVALVHLACTG